jgi:hypothetical protein
MLCPKCGAMIGDDSAFCSKCGAEVKKEAPQPAAPPVTPPVVQGPQQVETYSEAPNRQAGEPQPQPAAPAEKPPTYLVQNILLTVFSVICGLCWALPTSVTGLVFSAIADGAIRQNELARAAQNSRLARIFMWISFGLEAATAAFAIIAAIIGLATGASVLSQLFQNNGFGFHWGDYFNNFR